MNKSLFTCRLLPPFCRWEVEGTILYVGCLDLESKLRMTHASRSNTQQAYETYATHLALLNIVLCQ